MKDWEWSLERVKGKIPQPTRGHSAIYLDFDETIIFYGGCSGQNMIVGDCYKLDTRVSY